MADETKAADYRPGLEGVIAGISAISEVDAERNALIYRGYDIHDLVQECTFDEVAYLLLFGSLPNRAEVVSFQKKTAALRDAPGYVYDLLRQFPADAHPMDTLKAAVAALAPNDPLRDDNSPDACREKATRLYAVIPTLVVNAYRIAQGQTPATPDASLTHSANFFHMLRRARRARSLTRSRSASLTSSRRCTPSTATMPARLLPASPCPRSVIYIPASCPQLAH